MNIVTATKKVASPQKKRPALAVTQSTDADDLSRVFEQASDMFAIMASPARLKIMHFLCDGEKSVMAITDFVGAGSQANTSQHLALMYRAGIVGKRRDGNSTFYRIVSDQAVAVCRTVCTQIAIEMAV